RYPLDALMPDPSPAISENLEHIHARIQRAATAAGRDPAEIRLIAVSKYMPVEFVHQAIKSGHSIFGENTLQDALEKLQAIPDPRIEWHFIGHLQSNKARLVPGNFHWLHTLDSLKLARKLSGAWDSTRPPLQVLMQVNIASDPNKFGLAPTITAQFASELLQLDLPGISLRGLMTIGRANATPDERRHDFIALRKLRDEIAAQLGIDTFSELSMGMSDDFEIAIAEGATMVRVGRSIFGSRPAVRA
ncbi:MAG TPA: YggS family pyridoxal phosphate-dependent enzyme, partial [Gammaproteobacteria bacterium]|nr:YggS family pyridoxal phosphate-dependent enzyme [Gammaproteobacteria bacterium]